MPDTRSNKRARVEEDPSPQKPTDDVTMVEMKDPMCKEEEDNPVAADESDEDLPERSDVLWYDDGNIILQADKTQFRVHKSILSQHSTVLRDTFKVPRPLPTPKNTQDGCQVVKMDGDKDYHWEFLLQLLYNGRQ